tara:strand:+ start:174 stop:1352 length:1179 start_codon:yes stop_codon:yes gene_type:complete
LHKKNKEKWLILAPSNFNDLYVSNHLIALSLSKYVKTTYVESPGVIGINLRRIFKLTINLIYKFFYFKSHSKEFLGLKKTHFPKGLTIKKRLSIPLLGIPYFDSLIFFFNRSYRQSIYQLLNESNHIILCSPIWITFFKGWESEIKKKDIKQSFYFHLVDDPESYRHLKNYMEPLYKKISDFSRVISPNKILLSKYVEKSKHFHMPHGFNQILQRKEYMKNYKRKKYIVYAGTFASWVEYDLIDLLCKYFVNEKIILIGKPAKDISYDFIKKFEKKNKNLIILNQMDKKDLHKFLLKCSVAIIPYNPSLLHIKNCSPSKIMDYLGCGLPVVSSNIPYSINHKFVKVANNHKEFINQIKKALLFKESKRSSLIKYSLDNNWDNKVWDLMKKVK